MSCVNYPLKNIHRVFVGGLVSPRGLGPGPVRSTETNYCGDVGKCFPALVPLLCTGEGVESEGT